MKILRKVFPPKQEILVNGQWHPLPRRPKNSQIHWKLILVGLLFLLLIFLMLFYFGRNYYLGKTVSKQKLSNNVIGHFSYFGKPAFLTNQGGLYIFDKERLKNGDKVFIKILPNEKIASVLALSDDDILLAVNQQSNKMNGKQTGKAMFYRMNIETQQLTEEISFLDSEVSKPQVRDDGLFLLNSNWLVWRSEQNFWYKILAPVPSDKVADWMRIANNLFLLSRANEIWQLDLDSITSQQPDPKWKKLFNQSKQSSSTSESLGLILQIVSNRILYLASDLTVNEWIFDDKFWYLNLSEPLPQFVKTKGYLYSGLKFAERSFEKQQTSICFEINLLSKCYSEPPVKVKEAYQVTPNHYLRFDSENYSIFADEPN